MSNLQMGICLGIILAIGIIAVARNLIQRIMYRSICLHKGEKAGCYCILCDKMTKCMRNQQNEYYSIYKRLLRLDPAEAEKLRQDLQAELDGKANKA